MSRYKEANPLGQRIRMALVQRNKTQADLAEYLGVTAMRVSQLIREGRWRIEDLQRVARYLNVSVAWLIEGKN